TPRRWRDAQGWGRSLALAGDDLAAGVGGQGAVDGRRQGLADEAHAAVAEQEVAAALVHAAEAAQQVLVAGRPVAEAARRCGAGGSWARRAGPGPGRSGR